MSNVAGNRSHAVVARRFESPDSLDDFPTPPWATRALMEHVITPEFKINNFRPLSVWEPAANRGYMARPLSEYFGRVVATDIFDYGYPLDGVFDFVTPPGTVRVADWIITNPPFVLAGKFIRRALITPGVSGVAMITRTSILESRGRFEKIWSVTPPTIVAQFVERVPMFKGRIDPKGSTATSYCWLVWRLGESGTRLVWVPPCRNSLEKATDYNLI